MKNNKKEIPIPEFEIKEENWYREKSIIEIFNFVDVESKLAESYLKLAGKDQANLRELLIRWGVWSRSMNIILRKIMNEPIPEGLSQEEIDLYNHRIVHVKLIYAYWWNRTHLIETYRKSFLGRIADKKNIQSGGKTISSMIYQNLSSEDIKKMSTSFYNLIERLSNQKELTAEETRKVLDGEKGPENTL